MRHFLVLVVSTALAFGALACTELRTDPNDPLADGGDGDGDGE